MCFSAVRILRGGLVAVQFSLFNRGGAAERLNISTVGDQTSSKSDFCYFELRIPS
jgi:hypothetical protein